jgi:hopanoid biosynthesis associated RND transporter like protein HpnN
LLLVLAVTVACGWYTATQLGFRTSRLDLINPNSEFNKRWIAFIEEFGDDDDLIVVLHCEDAALIPDWLDEVGEQLREGESGLRDVFWKVDLTNLRRKGLHYLSPETLEQTRLFLQRLRPVLDGDWSRLSLARMLNDLSREAAYRMEMGEETPLTELERLVSALAQTVENPIDYQSPWPAPPEPTDSPDQQGPQYLLAGEGKYGLILLRIDTDEASFTSGAASIDRLRAKLDTIRTTLPPGMELGLTGLPVMENDEMAASQDTMTAASLLSLVGVSLLFWASFGGWRHMILSVLALVIGMIWAFAYATASVGHLNILSVSFAVILIGLGIDFSIHYCARYLQLRTDGLGRERAILHAASSVGPGIVTGVLTTAVAFYMASLTEFTGVAELGIIAGGGIVVCGVAALVVLPLLLRLLDRKANHTRWSQPLPVGRWIAPILNRPGVALIAALSLTALLAAGVPRLWYDHNLLNLQPEGIESVVWEHRLLEDSNQSCWYALSVADSPEELLARERQFQKLACVDRTEQVASLLATDGPGKLETIGTIAEQLIPLPSRPPLVPVPAPGQLDRVLYDLESLLAQRGGVEPLSSNLARLRRRLAEQTPTEYYAVFGQFQQQVVGDLWQRLSELQQASDPIPPSLDELPDGLVTRFVGREGKLLLKIYAKGSVWDMDSLGEFVAAVRTVDPAATGKPLQTFEASRQMEQAYQRAALYALAAIFVLLLLDFGNVRDSLLAMVPLAMGMVQLFGLLGWLGIPLNPANIVVLPLILGIGVDDGVHVMHDYRRQPGRYRTSDSTAGSILLTSLTTMVGFGSLMIADHRGIESLGKVMVLGSLTCWFSSFVILPAMLRLVSRGRDSKPIRLKMPEPQAQEELPVRRAA